MKKMVLAFSSKERMAEFVLECKIIRVKTNLEDITLTGIFSDECLDIAIKEYGAFIPNPPDFIIY